MAPRIVAHASYQDFLDTVARAGGDNHLTGTSLGPLGWLFSVGAEFNGLGTQLPDDKLCLLYTVWEDEVLKLAFSRLSNRKNDLVSPLDPSEYPSLGPHLALLAQTLLADPLLKADPRLLRSTFGPETLVDPFLTHWPLSIAPPAPEDKLANQTLRLLHISEVPPPATLPSGHLIERGTEESMSTTDKEAMCGLLDAFYNWDKPTDQPLSGMSQLEDTMTNGALFVYRTHGGQIVSFVVLGRPTSQTMAIRNVYTHPNHRRQGIAERVTREVARIYLTAERPVYDFKGSPPPFDKATHWGGRGTVCLFVADENPNARSAYLKAGFQAGKERWVDRVVEGTEPGVW